MNYTAVALCILFCTGFCSSETLALTDDSQREINAEVSVTSKTGEQRKLVLVSVYFLTAEQYASATDTTAATYKAAIEVLNNQDSVQNYQKNIVLAEKYEKLRNNYEKYGPESFKKTIPEMEAKHQHYLALAKNHVRFTSDVRALHYTLNAYTANGRNHVINEVTNADGKFVVRLKRQKYFVYAIDSRKLPTGTEEYRWLFEYTPDGSVLKLTNDNMN